MTMAMTDGFRIFDLLFEASGWDGVIPEPYPLPGLDPTPDALTCDGYFAMPLGGTDGEIRLGNILASPGSEVAVPILVTNSNEVLGLQIVVGYDPISFTPTELVFEGTFYERLGVS